LLCNAAWKDEQGCKNGDRGADWRVLVVRMVQLRRWASVRGGG
jgi:hypothetical protein